MSCPHTGSFAAAALHYLKVKDTDIYHITYIDVHVTCSAHTQEACCSCTTPQHVGQQSTSCHSPHEWHMPIQRKMQKATSFNFELAAICSMFALHQQDRHGSRSAQQHAAEAQSHIAHTSVCSCCHCLLTCNFHGLLELHAFKNAHCQCACETISCPCRIHHLYSQRSDTFL